MKVLLFSRVPFFPQQVGGREWVIHETAEALRRDGHQPIVMCGLAPQGSVYWRSRIRGALTRRRFPPDTSMPYPVFRGWDYREGIEEVVARTSPGVAIVESTGDAVEIVQRLGALGVPAVVRLHDSALHMLTGDLQSIPHTPFIAVSRFLADLFEARFGRPATVIPPLVLPERCATPTSRSKVVFVNPRPVKGAAIVMQVARSCPQIPFRFFEAWLADDEVRALKREAEQLPNVEWVRSVMDPRLIYADAHTMLVPSRGNETWCRVATEAHFSGIPVIATRRGGLPESVGPGGILVDVEADAGAWTEAVLSVWNDPQRYRALCDASAQFGRRPEISAAALMQRLYETVDRAVSSGAG